MKSRLTLSLPIHHIFGSEKVTTVIDPDQEALAELMLDAYKGTVDYEGESLEDAREEIGNIAAGKYGTFLKDHSFLSWEEGILASATLVTLFEEKPLLAIGMTRSEFKRRGHAKELITASAISLQKAGYKSLDLWVTDTNEPAVNLYRKLGFREA